MTTSTVAPLDLERSRRLVLGEILARNARRHPDKVALVFEGEQLTFGELDARVDRLANALLERGVQHGEKVAILMYNKLEVVESFFACQKIGACPVPINFRLAPGEVAYILGNADAVAVLADGELASLAREAADRLTGIRFTLVVGDAAPEGAESYEEALAAASTERPGAIVDEGDLAFLMYTSGTTGLPKGAMLTHRNVVTNTLNWVTELQPTRDDVWLSGVPLFHIGGVNGVLPFIYLGATCVITPSTNFDPDRSLQLLADRQVTMCYFVPTQWQQICSCPGVTDIDTSRLRIALWGASQAPLSTLELMARTFPAAGIVNAFGQTEMSSNTAFLHPADSRRKMGSVGKPAINVEVRIVDEAMHDVPRGEVGEMVYRGPTVMAGYYNNEEASRAAFAGGWFHSGDLAREDSEGFIYVVDRTKDMIISGGENIYPAEVERVVERHPAVAEVAVVGVPHPRWVETPVAFIVPLGDEPAAEEIIELVRENLASYKKPSAVVYVDELPRNASGKILKRQLRDQFAALFEAAEKGET